MSDSISSICFCAMWTSPKSETYFCDLICVNIKSLPQMFLTICYHKHIEIATCFTIGIIYSRLRIPTIKLKEILHRKRSLKISPPNKLLCKTEFITTFKLCFTQEICSDAQFIQNKNHLRINYKYFRELVS